MHYDGHSTEVIERHARLFRGINDAKCLFMENNATHHRIVITFLETEAEEILLRTENIHQID